MTPADAVDTALELPIVPSFTRIGIDVRRRTDGWDDLDGCDLTGRVVVVTGATSGLGRAAVNRLARLGADLVITGRNADRTEAAATELRNETGNPSITGVAADMGDLEQVRALADAVLGHRDRLDVLVHNAGALTAERTDTADGIESTVASQVVGPFLLTTLLLDRLRSSAPSRVVTMSSGGMYGSPLVVGNLEMAAPEYRGAEQYARAKRAQVTLNEMWAERFGADDIHFHALHPGWAATPGVDSSLPTFSRLMGPLLRTPDQGADTLVWLAADDAALASNGGFWHDRRRRSIHRFGRTRRSDTPSRRAALWDHVAELARVEPG